MPYADIAGLNIYYEEHGDPLGPTLLLLHNFTGAGMTAWRHQIEPFGASFRLVVPDWRGHGRTNNPGGLSAMNHRQFARDIIGLCEHLKLDKPIICGTSSGAMLLLGLAVTAPSLARALRLAGGTYYFGQELRARMRLQTAANVTPERRDALRAIHTALGENHWQIVQDAFAALADHKEDEDFPPEDELRAIAVPVLIVHGDRDSLFPVDVPISLYKLLPNSELCLLPNTGHLPQAMQPALFNAVTLDYLNRLPELQGET